MLTINQLYIYSSQKTINDDDHDHDNNRLFTSPLTWNETKFYAKWMDAWAHHANYIEKNRPRVGLGHFRVFFFFSVIFPLA